MISGYYKSHTGEVYYVICDAIKANDNNTQDRFIVYKPIDNNTIFVTSIEEFNGYIDNADGERLKRFKKVNEEYPTWPPTISVIDQLPLFGDYISPEYYTHELGISKISKR